MKLKALPLTPASARNAALINQLATPGLGSLLVGKLAVGFGQLAVAATGFFFVMAWFAAVLRQYYRQFNGSGENKPLAWIGLTGGGLFLTAWVWSLITSIGLIRQARRNAAAATNVPPVISP